MQDTVRATPRPMGVKIAEEGARNQVEPNKVIGLTEAKMFVVYHGDEYGRKVATTVFQTGDGQLLATANSTQWTMTLKPVSKWLREQVEQRQVSAAVRPEDVVVETDSVDVMVED